MSLSASEQAIVDRVPTGLFIGGSWRPATGGGTFGVEDPASGEVFTQVADGTPGDAMAALDAACAAQADWAATAPRERGEILRRTFETLVARADELAVLMTLEMGKPVAESKGEITYGAEFLRWFAEEAVRISGRFGDAPAGDSRLLVVKKPVGPCVLVTPWNFPLAMATRKVGPAIAAGCTMVLKPAALTPLTALAFAQVLADAGLPAGVLNVVTTKKAGAAIGPLLADPRSRKISFTGSTEVGKALMVQASETVMRTSMELGGNAPFLVFADADVDAAVDGAMLAKMRNGGEACTAANRFHVHVDVAAEFSAKLTGAHERRRDGPRHRRRRGSGPDGRPGDGRQVPGAGGRRGESQGATDPRRRHRPRRARLLLPGDRADGRARRRRGSSRRRSSGRWRRSPPSAPSRRASRRRTTPSSGWPPTPTPGRWRSACRLPTLLETGMLGLNRGLVSNPAAPFGGVKESGVGREGGIEGVAEYMDTLYVSLPA